MITFVVPRSRHGAMPTGDEGHSIVRLNILFPVHCFLGSLAIIGMENSIFLEV